MSKWRAAFVGISALLAGCATDQAMTVDDVNHAVPKGGYHKILVFVENDEQDQLDLENAIVTKLRNSGVNADSSLALFQFSRKNFDPKEMGSVILNRGFDSVLYVDVIKNGVVTKNITDKTYQRNQNGYVICSAYTIIQYCYPMPNYYSVDKNGALTESSIVLMAKSELYDVHSNQDTWTAETSISSNGSDPTDIPKLFADLAQQITLKLQAEKIIPTGS